jgi:hypothetical protein
MALQKKDIDVSKVFLAYVALQGDPNRVALAVNLDAEEVRALAIQENWEGKIGQVGALREKDSNFQITLNRALSYVQAQQLSTLIDEVIKHWSADPAGMLDDFTTTTKNGSTFSTKALTDLVKAAEMVANMKARALGDTGVPEADDRASGASIGLSVANALNAVAGSAGMDSVSIVKKSLEASNAHVDRHPGAKTPSAS